MVLAVAKEAATQMTREAVAGQKLEVTPDQKKPADSEQRTVIGPTARNQGIQVKGFDAIAPGRGRATNKERSTTIMQPTPTHVLYPEPPICGEYYFCGRSCPLLPRRPRHVLPSHTWQHSMRTSSVREICKRNAWRERSLCVRMRTVRTARLTDDNWQRGWPTESITGQRSKAQGSVCAGCDAHVHVPGRALFGRGSSI
jgi:hypothetical protein